MSIFTFEFVLLRAQPVNTASLAGAATSVTFVMTKTNTCLLWHKHLFVATKHIFCCKKSMLVATKLLSWQTFFCHDKHMYVTIKLIFLVATKVCLFFVATKIFCHNKHNFVATKVLSRQTYFCHNKRCVLLWQTCICHDNTCLLRQNFCYAKWYLWQLPPMIIQVDATQLMILTSWS